MTRIYAALALCLALGAGGWYLHHRWYGEGVAHEQAIEAVLAAKFNEQARATEQAQARELADVAIRYEHDKADAQAIADRTIADLRAGTVRLSRRWQCPANVPSTAATPSQRDASADDRNESAGRIVHAADDADAQIRALQQILIDERKQ